MTIRSDVHLFVVLGCLLAILLPTRVVQAQVNRQTCLDNIEQASSQIADGFFNEAIALLTPCQEAAFLDADEQTHLFKLLADAYLANRNLTEAREAISRILDISPNFTPDINLDSQLFRNLVAELQAERAIPETPQGFTATIENDRILLTWSPLANGAEIDRILVLRGESDSNMSNLDSVSTEQTSYTDTSALPGVDYSYGLQAVGVNGVAGAPSETRRIMLPLPVTQTNGTPIDETAPQSKPMRKFVFIGGGILVAGGVAAALALSGGENAPPPAGTLPGPPSVP